MNYFKFFLWIFVGVFGIIILSSSARAEEKKLYNVKGKRDPFVQLVGSGSRASTGGLLGVESVEEIVIEGIVHDVDPAKSIVIANGTVLNEGKEEGNVKVLKIDPKGALFSVNGIEGYKSLYQADSKKAESEKIS